MKLKALLSTVLVAGAVFGSSALMAAPSHSSHSMNTINLAALDARIDSGVARGKLTRGEERVLRSELKSLRTAVKAALKDHRVTTKERAALERKETKLKSHIYKLSNNRVMVRGTYQHDRRDDHRRGSYQEPQTETHWASIRALPNGSRVYVK